MNGRRSMENATVILAIAAAISFQTGPSSRRKDAPVDRESATKRRTIQSESDDAALTKAFSDGDTNGNGWISFKEAQAAMSLDRDSFAIFDKDHDGRINPAEFKERHAVILRFGGAFPMPIDTAATRTGSGRSAEELLRIYDQNADGALDTLELKQALDEHKISALTAEVAIETIDQDRSGKLEAAEIERLTQILTPSGAAETGPAPRSIAELFGKVYARETPPGATPQAPLIPGPVSAFRRLDFDEDGRIDAQDLLELARPIQVRVRVHALLATLDSDGDGTLSEAEFWASMDVVR